MGKRRKTNSKQAKALTLAKELVVDLHRLTRVEATESLEQILDKALVQGCSRIKVIHGIGTGAVKRAVHEYLAGAKHVQDFHGDPVNPGVTWVNL